MKKKQNKTKQNKTKQKTKKQKKKQTNKHKTNKKTVYHVKTVLGFEIKPCKPCIILYVFLKDMWTLITNISKFICFTLRSNQVRNVVFKVCNRPNVGRPQL